MSRLPRLKRKSPGGQRTCPSTGPLDADIVLLLESPASNEIREQEPAVGRAGQVLNKCLVPAGIRRVDIRIINLVPCQAPGNRFADHDPRDIEWGLKRLRLELAVLEDPKVIMPMGANPLKYLLDLEPISDWRGSLIPPIPESNGDLYNHYWLRLGLRGQVESPVLQDVAFLPTFHPAGVARRMEWHYWMVNDLKRARKYTLGEDFERRERDWYLNDPDELERVVDEVVLGGENMVAVDTEMDPLVTCLVTEEEVHSFVWSEDYRRPLERVMGSSQVLKVAHNMAHDWRQFEKVYDIRVEPPWFDSIGGAQILQPSGGRKDRQAADKARARAGQQLLGKSLSPHIATEYTGWPYHKWLADKDMLAYCGMDTVVAYDAYWPQIRKLYDQPDKLRIAEQDHRMFEVLFRATAHGLQIDTEAWLDVVEDYEEECEDLGDRLTEKAWGHITKALDAGKLKKPHLFREEKQCPCCGGGSSKVEACWSCAGLESGYRKGDIVELAEQRGVSTSDTKAEIEERVLGKCRECDGKGTRTVEYPLNLQSGDQIRALFYQALGIPPRRYKGKVTTRFEQLERMLEPGGYLGPDCAESRQSAREMMKLYVELAERRSELQDLRRLEPDDDGRVRCVFDLWYTPTHRVASREGLLDKGSNLQNIPKKARKFVVPDPGEFFLYPDYAQIEGRCQAVLTKDEGLLELYRSGKNSHREVQRIIREEAGVELSYSQAKRVSFASFYDVEAGHLADVMGCSKRKALLSLRAFFKAFPGARRYKRTVEKELRQSRSCTTPTGWVRRWLGYVLETRGRRKGEVKRKIRKEALATGPQNMAAWVMAEGLLAVWDNARWMRPQLHVHDSALLGVELGRAAEAVLRAEELMEIELWGMTFPVESVCGPDWYGASVDDEDKEEEGYGGWERSEILENGVPS